MAGRFTRRMAVRGCGAALCLALAAPLPASAQKGPDVRFMGRPTALPNPVPAGRATTVRGSIVWDGKLGTSKIVVAAYLCRHGRCAPGSRSRVDLVSLMVAGTSGRKGFQLRFVVPEGSHSVEIVADDGNLVRERDEKNNRILVAVKGLPAAAAAGGGGRPAGGSAGRPALPALPGTGMSGRGMRAAGAGAGTAAGVAGRPLLDRSTLRQIQERARRFQQELARSRGGRLMLQLQTAASNVLGALRAYWERVGQCASPSHPYTGQDRRAAGCRDTDTIAECTNKLVAWCARQEAGRLSREVARLVEARSRMRAVLEKIDECERVARLSMRGGHGAFGRPREGSVERYWAYTAVSRCWEALDELR